MEKMIATEKIEECFTTLKNGEIYRSVIDTTEKILIEKALERTLGNQIVAAKLLGLNRNTLRTKIKRLNIDLSLFRRINVDSPMNMVRRLQKHPTSTSHK